MTSPVDVKPDLLVSVIAAHGGLERFNDKHSIEAVVSGSGAAFARKGYPGHHTVTAMVDTKVQKVVFQGAGFAGKNTAPTGKLIWTPQRVWTENSDGSIAGERNNPRDAFHGHNLMTPWDDFHLLYFRGYALWNYLVAPFYFTWPGFTTRELEPHSEDGQEWRVLEVTYPEGFAAHNKIQKYYYDKDYKLRRLDYNAEVMGATAPIGQYCYDHKSVDGILFPFLRRVIRVPDGILNGGPSMVLLDIVDIRFREDVQAEKL